MHVQYTYNANTFSQFKAIGCAMFTNVVWMRLSNVTAVHMTVNDINSLSKIVKLFTAMIITFK